MLKFAISHMNDGKGESWSVAGMSVEATGQQSATFITVTATAVSS